MGKKNKGNKVRQNFPKKKRSFKKKGSLRKAKKIKRKKKSNQKQKSTKKLKLKQKKKSKKVKPQRSKKQMKNPRMKESCSRQSTFCPVEKATSLKLLYNQVYNFQKQLKRAQNQAKIVQKKKLKNNIFMKDALILTDIVGGNLTDPTCSATAANKRSASQASSAGSTLAACSASITTSCQDITINATLTGSCSATMTAYEKKIAECRSSGCSCWTEAVAMKSDVTRCNAVTESDTVKTKKKTCLKTFSGCKKAQDSAVEYTATCPAPVTSTSTTSSPSTATIETSTSSPDISNTTTPIEETPVNMTMETPVNMTLETPVSMISETPVNMTMATPVNMTLETPVLMTLETPIVMTVHSTGDQTATTRATYRKDILVKSYVAKAIRNYWKRS